MTIELSKYKERDMLQMNELSDLRQSNVLFERVYLKSIRIIFYKISFLRKNLIFKLNLIHYVRNL
jgi:hypothetical protein